MRLPAILRLRLRSLLGRNRVERELDEELRYHLERQVEEYLATGQSREEAHRSMGAVTQAKEECRDMRGMNWIDNGVQDFRYAFRQLRKSPGFACTATFVLALGISAAISIFGLAEAALIRPLPYRDPARLVSAFEATTDVPRYALPYLDFLDWQKLNRVFGSLDAYALNGGFTLSGGAGAEPVTGTRVSPGFFRTLGVALVLGRDFRPGEDSEAVISFETWQQRFGGSADVLGATAILNGIPRTIVGVLPREFHFAPAGRAEFWTTLRSTDPCEQQRGCQNLHAVARLADGISLETAAAEMRLITRQVQSQYPEAHREVVGATLMPLREIVVGQVRPILLVLLAGAGVLFLLSCVNVTLKVATPV
jgi:hypothetical protein